MNQYFPTKPSFRHYFICSSLSSLSIVIELIAPSLLCINKLDLYRGTCKLITAFAFVQLLSGVWLCSTPGVPVLHYLPEFAQTHVHWVNDVIQQSHPLSSPSPPVLNLSQHQGLFQWATSLYQVAKVLELQHQYFQWIFRVDFLWDWLVWSPCCLRDSKESSAPQFENINSLALSLLYSPTFTSVI